MKPLFSSCLAAIVYCYVIYSPAVIILQSPANNLVFASPISEEHREPYSDDRPVILPQVPEAPPPEEAKPVKPPAIKFALTFDDGPHPEYTPQILNLLKKHGAKATFFIVGMQADAYPEIVQRVITEGHEIGNHTQGHLSTELVGYWSAYRDAEEGFRTITNIIKKPVTDFRAPYGEWSSAYSDACDELKMTAVWWDVDSSDWRRRGAENIASLVLSQLDPGEIVLMHDGGGNRSQTVTALAMILESLQAKGWSSVTISELNSR